MIGLLRTALMFLYRVKRLVQYLTFFALGVAVGSAGFTFDMSVVRSFLQHFIG